MVHPVLLLLSRFRSVSASGRRGAGGGIVDLAFGGVFQGGFGCVTGFEAFVFLFPYTRIELG